MSEFDLHKFENECHPEVIGSSTSIEKHIFNIMSIFWADKSFIKHVIKKDLDLVESTYFEFRETEIVSNLIQIAIIYRLEEYSRLTYPHYKKKYKPETKIVGKLFEKLKTKSKQLTMYEACNKIIHADKIKFDRKKFPKSREYYLTPKLYLYGTKNKQNWRAVLEILEFCKNSYRYGEDFFEFDGKYKNEEERKEFETSVKNFIKEKNKLKAL